MKKLNHKKIVVLFVFLIALLTVANIVLRMNGADTPLNSQVQDKN